MSRYDYQVRLDGATEAVKNFMRAADNVAPATNEDGIDLALQLVYLAAEEASDQLEKIKEAPNEF